MLQIGGIEPIFTFEELEEMWCPEFMDEAEHITGEAWQKAENKR